MAFSLKLLRCRDRALPPLDGHTCGQPFFLRIIHVHTNIQATAIQDFLTKNFLQMNAQKCELVLHSRGSVPENAQAEVGSATLTATTASKCLGIWWTSDLSPSKAITENISKAQKAFFSFGCCNVVYATTSISSCRPPPVPGVCRLSHSELNWTQCDGCHLWFHNEYMNIPQCVFFNSHDLEWMCKPCSSFQHIFNFFKYPTNYCLQ